METLWELWDELEIFSLYQDHPDVNFKGDRAQQGP